ncbi:hypothetical protein Hamer_G008187 [Homarus americanus]|uniref:Uncharacterized protein n=1 Tax=Homarus americanus TaxID=6706 RepID=A0A8J5NEI3_HOMAM|nr:hypothetical protein Hamer_G008187 [Homarus americanus]
MYPTQRYATRS